MPQNSSQYVQLIQDQCRQLDSMINIILNNIDEQIQISEFKDLAETILQSFEDSN